MSKTHNLPLQKHVTLLPIFCRAGTEDALFGTSSQGAGQRPGLLEVDGLAGAADDEGAAQFGVQLGDAVDSIAAAGADLDGENASMLYLVSLDLQQLTAGLSSNTSALL